MDTSCLIFGGLTSVVITFLKGVPFIARNPKWVALICSILIAGVQSWYHGALPTAAALAACVLTQLSGSVATHEIIVKKVQSTVAGV